MNEMDSTNIDAVGAVMSEMKQLALAERADWSVEYKIIENYITEHALILAGPMAVRLFASNGPTVRDLDDFIYTVYVPGEDTYIHAHALTDKLAEAARQLRGVNSNDSILSGPGELRIPTMKTVLAHKKFIISVNFRPLCIMMRLMGPNRDVNIRKVVRPVSRQWFNGHDNVDVLPLDLQMIDLCHDMYDPVSRDNWSTIWTTIKLLMNDEKVGGRDHDRHKDRRHIERTGPSRDFVHKEILERYVVGNSNCILIGYHGLKLIGGDIDDNMDLNKLAITIISADLEADCGTIVAFIEKLGGHAEVNRRQMSVMADDRIIRAVIRLDGRDLCYVYNSAEYDLIPTIKRSDARDKKNYLHIGTPLVIMRFLLIETWILRWVMATITTNEDFMARRIRDLVTGAITCYELVGDTGPVTIDVADYVGHYSNEELAVKISSTASGKHYKDYCPLMRG
jgi:hypothetical protein